MADPVAVIFDLDGTLIDSAPEIHAAANAVMLAQGMPPLPFAQVKSFIGNGVGILLVRCLVAQGHDGAGPLHAPMMAAFLDNYETQFSRTTLYPGVQDMLQTLAQRGHPLAICTNKPERPTRAILTHFNLLHYFPVIIGGDTLPQRKPDPAPLHAAHQALGGGPAVFVGDSEVDAETAHAAALPFALFTGGYRTRSVADLSPAIVFDNHQDLIRHLG